MSTRVDYIIVGQGLAGSALAMECIKRGKTIRVFDSPSQNRSSTIAAGICNPITGKAMSKTYLAEKIFPFLHAWYRETEEALGVRFFKPLPVFRPFLSEAEQRQWLNTTAEVKDFVTRVWAAPYEGEKLSNPHGGLELSQSGMLAASRWLVAVRKYLEARGLFEEHWVDENEIQAGREIQLRDVHATRLIFCNGLAALKGKWFHWVPIRALKGETVTVRMDFPADKIISRAVYLVPSEEQGVFTAGSTYQHEPFETGVTPAALKDIVERLGKLVRVPFEVIHQDWGIRPTVSDRRPLVGRHPKAENVIIFNGMGTKGVSLTPYFASALVDYLDRGIEVPYEVNISRFKSLYSN